MRIKRLIGWGIWLYPPSWRARYRDEFLALVEDSPSRPSDLWDVLQGAIQMRMKVATLSKLVAGFALAGLIGAGLWSYWRPDQFVSTSILKMTGDQDRTTQMKRLQKAQQTALSRNSLARVIVQENLYPDARREKPLEDVIADMRNHDIRIVPAGKDVALSFSYSDPTIAQKTTRDLLAALNREDQLFEVLDPASTPTAPAGPSRARIIGTGLIAGLAAGLLAAGFWAIVRRSSPWTIQRVSAFAAVGMAAGATLAFLIPDQFISASVLRLADDSKLQPALERVTGDPVLNAIARKYGLYPHEANPAAHMRGDLRIQRIRAVQGPARTAFTVSFRSSDRFKAQAVTRDLTANLMQETGAEMEVLDPASDPIAPSSPNRLQIIVLGVLAGLLLGLTYTRFRRPPVAVAAAGLVALTILTAVPSQAQTDRPQFEVASIKLNHDCGNRRGGGTTPVPGRLNLSCQTPASLIYGAHVAFANGSTINMKIPEVTGLPDWAQSDTYDINAKAADQAPVPQMFGPMLQALLEERFKLKIHRETKEVPVYFLTEAKGGIKLEPIKEGSCIPIDVNHLPAPPKPGEPRPIYCGNQSMGRNGSGTTTIKASGITLDTLAGGPLSRTVGRPIIDKTGLTALYDIHLEFSTLESTDSAAESIFGALQKLGLKLESGKGPRETLVVDHIERPSEN
jgi:uncharacterized protein (TIGR03435 family)